MVEITPIFATPFAVVPVAEAPQLNPALISLLRTRADEAHRDPATPADPRCFRGRETLFEWREPEIGALRMAMLGGACAAIMAVTPYTEAEFDALSVQARARVLIVRPDGCVPAGTAPMASWYAIYCVAAPSGPAVRADSGVLRLYGVRQTTMFVDAANWSLRTPYQTGHYVWRPVPGHMALFPASVAHEVALNRSAEELLLVAARLRFTGTGQVEAPPW